MMARLSIREIDPMSKRPLEGLPSIFRGKDRLTGRVQGLLTRFGRARVEAARKPLAKLTGRKASTISQGDLIEYLARGDENTKAYLAGKSP